ncbi:response regulator [Haloarcula sp. Atlit-7R]|uniref:response regulator n=1 Tax=Haloarcula sp. Atlit-7R TaxID=2282125 RepID=UPI000EF13CAC|nr:response regulator [Haloarcula sp. Atlit-7R]RLM94364.1 response regulator [Haloarcula sp. Atlit-7R]
MGEKGRVLHVDDQQQIRYLFCDFVDEFQYDFAVDTAPDGDEALDMIDGSTYDCIITDQEMPKVTGLELVRNLEERPVSIPVVVFTSVGDKETLAELRGADVSGVYTKGDIGYQELLSNVNSIVKAQTDSTAPQQQTDESPKSTQISAPFSESI